MGAVAHPDLAGAVKEALTMDQVARRYGFEPSRAGFIKCPFHKGDRTASLKLYPGSRGWCCFGCHRGGSAIDFVMELYGLSFAQAVVRLNADFGLGLTWERPTPAARAKALEERRRATEKALWLQEEYRALAREHLYWYEVQKYFAPTREMQDSGAIHPLYAEAVKRLPVLDYRIEEWELKYGRTKDHFPSDGTA